MADRSLNGLLDFLEYLGAKGLMQRNTVSGRKAAASRVLGVLDPEEASDVTALDLDDVMGRFYNLEGKSYKPDSLAVYKSRVNAAISDFRSYLDNPASFKPSTAMKKGKNDGPTKRPPSQKPVAQTIEVPRIDSSAHTATVNVFPIPIRPDVVVRIHGLPFDLTQSEADKIANVVKAMAMT